MDVHKNELISMANESSDSDSTGSWLVVPSVLDENEASSSTPPIANADEPDCSEPTGTSFNKDAADFEDSMSNEMDEDLYIEDAYVDSPPANALNATEECLPNSETEVLNSEIDFLLSSLNASSNSCKSSSLDSQDLYRESSPSTDSGRSDSSFSVIPEIARQSTPDLLEGIHGDFVDLSSVSSLRDELPANVELLPGKRHYVHIRNTNLNKCLNIAMLLSLSVVIGLGIGNFVGMSRQFWLARQSSRFQVVRIKQLQDELILCLRDKSRPINSELELLKDTENYQWPSENNWKALCFYKSFLDWSNARIHEKSEENGRLLPSQDNMVIAELTEEQKNALKSQEVKIRQLEEENSELQDALHDLYEQIEKSRNAQFMNSANELSVEYKVKNIKDQVNQMISENEELKAAIVRLRYTAPLVPMSDEANSTSVNEEPQNTTIGDIYNYWEDTTISIIRDKLPLLEYNVNWIEYMTKHDNQDSISFDQLINNALSQLFTQATFLKDDIYARFNIGEIQRSIGKKLKELETFAHSVRNSKYSRINKTTKKMKEIIGVAVKKLYETVERFQKSEKMSEFKLQKLYSKVAEITQKLDRKWSEVKGKWSQYKQKPEKEEKNKSKKNSHADRMDQHKSANSKNMESNNNAKHKQKWSENKEKNKPYKNKENNQKNKAKVYEMDETNSFQAYRGAKHKRYHHMEKQERELHGIHEWNNEKLGPMSNMIC